MYVVPFILVVLVAATVADLSNLKQKIEIVDFLSGDFFGSRVVIFLKLENEGNEMIKSASVAGLLSTVLEFNEMGKIANLRMYPVPIIVASLNKENIPKFSAMTHEVEMSNFYWIVFVGPFNDLTVANPRVPFNCKFLVVSVLNDKVSFTEIYQIAEKKPLLSNDLGYLNQEALPKTGFYFRRLNFMGTQLNYLTHVLDPCGDNSFATGFVVPCIHEKVWKLTAEALNITTKPVLYDEKSFLLISQTLRKTKIEVSITGVFLSSVTVSLFNFFWPLFKTDLEVYNRYGGLEISWNRYLRPFTPNIWIALLMCIFGCSLLLFLAYKLARNYLHIKRGCRKQQFWTPIFAFLSQGSTEPAFSAWERLLLVSVFIGPAVLIPAYSASLTSFLAVQIPDVPFTDLSQMKNHPQHRLTGLRAYDLHSFLQGEDETTKYLVNHGILSKEKQPANDVEGVVRMCKEPLAFISSTFFITALKPPCKYYVLPKKFVTFHQSMTMAKNSPYELPFNIIMRNLRFSGVLQTLKYNVTRKEIFDLFLDEEHSVELPPVDFNNILVLIFFLCIALALSILILFIERGMFHKVIKRRRIRERKMLSLKYYPFHK